MKREIFINRYEHACSFCKHGTKVPKIIVSYTQWFNVGYEWEDSHTEYSCLACEIKGSIRQMKHKLTLPLRRVKELLQWKFKYGVPMNKAWKFVKKEVR